MRKARLRKLNNQGSTFVMAIIVITLVTMLAVAILAASTHNIAMKNVDRNSKVTFYTAETVVDEVRAGTGLDGMTFLGQAYEAVITTLVKEDVLGFEYIVDNNEANKRFKTIFIESMLQKITDNSLAFESGKEYFISSDSVARQHVKTYLQKNIKGYDAGMASILSVGNIEAYKDSGDVAGRSYMIIIRDVAIRYKQEKGGETYFSNVTTDIEIQFPNMVVDFSASNRLNDYIKYVFIADDNIDITRYGVNSSASIYAGGLIDIKSDDFASGSLNMAKLDGSAENINVICGGNADDGVAGTISLLGNPNYKATFSAVGTNIWCTNLKTTPYFYNSVDNSKGTVITIGDTCSTFIKDDLTLDGQDSSVTLNGEYYGYSSDGAQYIHANSSAIIINGKRASLTIGTKKLLLGGHSYVELEENSDYYMLGEALSFKGDQEIYLVPSEYLGENYGMPIPNPMAETTWNNLNAAVNAAGSKVKICNLDKFFAKTKGYLDSTTPYTVKKTGDLVYLYLNFSNKANAAKYVYDVATGKDYVPNYLEKLLDQYTANLFEDSSVVIKDEAKDSLYTKGTLLTTNNKKTDSLNGDGSSELNNWTGATSIGLSGLGNDRFALTSLDLSNRYSILTHLLADIPWIDDDTNKQYIVNDVDSALWQKKNYIVSGTEMSATNVFDLIVDKSMILANEYNPTSSYIQYGGGRYTKVIVDGDYTIPDGCTGGIVVATGSVTVQNDFTGMIIAGRHIYVNDNVNVSNSPEIVEYLIKTEVGFEGGAASEDVPFSEYFYAYKHAASDDESREQVKVETVDYKDIIKVNNWRKYED